MIPEGFVPAVTAWFRENGRVLPWRAGRDPYRIWISEIMLQQTRIEAVIPYYHRFLERLPSVAALAACPEDELLKLWEGLGDYSRARNLKKAAEIITSRFGGEMPHTAKELAALPGIVDYTAGAIASIAFGEPAPAVDGNVLRVMTRVLGDESDIAQPAVKKRFTALLREVYPIGEKAALLTEGIMEIGERVCVPNAAPRCAFCPLRGTCVAFREGKTESLPVKSAKKARRVEKMTVFVLSSSGRYALCKREEPGLLAGMWEFYHLPGHLSKAAAKKALEREGFAPITIAPCGEARHLFTHIEWEMTGFSAEVANALPTLAWKTRDEIERDCAIPNAFRHFRKQMKGKDPL